MLDVAVNFNHLIGFFCYFSYLLFFKSLFTIFVLDVKSKVFGYINVNTFCNVNIFRGKLVIKYLIGWFCSDIRPSIGSAMSLYSDTLRKILRPLPTSVLAEAYLIILKNLSTGLQMGVFERVHTRGFTYLYNINVT